MAWIERIFKYGFDADPRHHAMLLAAGDKSGTSQKRFYRSLIAKADKRFDAHLDRIK